MNINRVPQLPPHDFSFPFLRRVGKVLRFCFNRMIDFSRLLFRFALRVKEVASQYFSCITPSSATEISHPISKTLVSPLLKRTFQNTFENLKIEGEEDEQIDPSRSWAHSFSRLNGTPIKEGTSKVIDVPDDGNCLFYAIAVGLRRMYSQDASIQAKLGWEVDPKELTGDLRQKGELLKGPGETLRRQAAGYLEKYLDLDEEIKLSIIEGLTSYLDAEKKKREEREEVIPILLNDIETLLQEAETPANTKKLLEKFADLQTLEESIASEKTNKLREDDHNGYIELTKKDHVYSGLPQIVALTKEYDIPIRVLYRYGKDDGYEQIFNEAANEKRDPPLPVLTIAHVNGNHFQFLDEWQTGSTTKEP